MKLNNTTSILRILALATLGVCLSGVWVSIQAAESNSVRTNGNGNGIAKKTTAVREADRHADVVFDNTISNITLMTWRGLEMGSRITLSGEVPYRYFLRFKFQYFLGGKATGKEKVQLRFYLNDGQYGEPGKLPFFALNEIPLIQGTNSYVVEAVPFAMPDTFTWTVQYYHVQDEAEVGLLFNGPPNVGFGEDIIWEKAQGQWVATTAPQAKSGFSAQVVAVSEFVEPFVPIRTYQASESSNKLAGIPSTPVPYPPQPNPSQPVVNPNELIEIPCYYQIP